MPPHGQADPSYIRRCIRCVEVGIIRCWWGYVKQVAVVNLTADNMEMCLGSSGGRRESQAVLASLSDSGHGTQ
jgi:hypothetical protein